MDYEGRTNLWWKAVKRKARPVRELLHWSQSGETRSSLHPDHTPTKGMQALTSSHFKRAHGHKPRGKQKTSGENTSNQTSKKQRRYIRNTNVFIINCQTKLNVTYQTCLYQINYLALLCFSLYVMSTSTSRIELLSCTANTKLQGIWTIRLCMFLATSCLHPYLSWLMWCT